MLKCQESLCKLKVELLYWNLSSLILSCLFCEPAVVFEFYAYVDSPDQAFKGLSSRGVIHYIRKNYSRRYSRVFKLADRHLCEMLDELLALFSDGFLSLNNILFKGVELVLF